MTSASSVAKSVSPPVRVVTRRRSSKNVRLLENSNSCETSKQDWQNIENRRKYFDWLRCELKIETPSQWYKVTPQLIKKHGGRDIMRYYKHSVINAVSELYPQHDWLPWKTKEVPLVYWKDVKNQRKFFDWAANQLGLTNYEGWYHVTSESVRKLGAGISTMMNRFYGNSLSTALKTVYPDIPWQLWKFKKVPQGYWEDLNHMREYVEYLASQLHVNQLSDWYLIDPYHQIPKVSSIAVHHTSFYDLLKKLYPHYTWQSVKQANRKIHETLGSKGQYLLFRTLHQIFPGVEIINNYKHKAPGRLELDVFLPDHRLAFEYQGKHHYMDHFLNGPVDIQQTRDQAKKAQCQDLGITLIEIPYWWDRSKSSLLATIHQYRPDLIPLPVDGQPIDLSFTQQLPRLKQKDDRKIPYYVGMGTPRGHAANCSGCKKIFTSASEPRLCVKGVFTPPSSHIPRPAKYYVCLSQTCLEKALEQYMLQNETGLHSAGIHFPLFEHVIQVPSDLQQKVLDKVGGAQLPGWSLWSKPISWA